MEEGLERLRAYLHQDEARREAARKQVALRKGAHEPVDRDASTALLIVDDSKHDHHRMLTAQNHSEGSMKAQQRISADGRAKRAAQRKENEMLDQLLREKAEKELQLQSNLDHSLREMRRAAAAKRNKTPVKLNQSHPGTSRSHQSGAGGSSRGADQNFLAVSWSLSAVPTLNLPQVKSSGHHSHRSGGTTGSSK